MISIANTKKVVTKGSSNVNQGQWAIIAITNASVEIKNNNQYKPFFLLRTSIRSILRKNRAEQLI